MNAESCFCACPFPHVDPEKGDFLEEDEEEEEDDEEGEEEEEEGEEGGGGEEIEYSKVGTAFIGDEEIEYEVRVRTRTIFLLQLVPDTDWSAA